MKVKSNIILKKFKKKYITKEYLKWLNNPKLMKYSEQRFHKHTLKSSIKYLKSFQGTENLFYAIFDYSKNLHIGNINAYIDKKNKVADIGILIGVPGKGYGFMAWEQMMEILFIKKNIRKITGGTMSINAPMIKIFKKNKMIFEYKKIKQFIMNGRYIDLVGYCAFNDKKK